MPRTTRSPAEERPIGAPVSARTQQRSENGAGNHARTITRYRLRSRLGSFKATTSRAVARLSPSPSSEAARALSFGLAHGSLSLDPIVAFRWLPRRFLFAAERSPRGWSILCTVDRFLYRRSGGLHGATTG